MVVFFSVLIKIFFYKFFCPIPSLEWYAARSYYDKNDNFKIEEPWKNMEVDLHDSQSEEWVGNQILAHRSR